MLATKQNAGEGVEELPESYTNAYIAQKALARSGISPASPTAFLAGANGPAPLYMYKKWRQDPTPDLPALAARMEREKTGDFLVALLQYAITPVQQSYAMGYLTHYTTACTLNVYLAAMCKLGMPYAGKSGRPQLEAALDSALYHEEHATRLVPWKAGTPVLVGDELAQVTTMLHDTILAVYGEDIPALALADTFHNNLSVRKFMVSRTGLRRLWARLFKNYYVDRRGKEGIHHRMQPAAPLRTLPLEWVNPATKERLDLPLEEVLAIAEQTGSIVVATAMCYWLGQLDEAQLRSVLKDNNYHTGQPNPTRGEDAPPKNGPDETPAGAAG